MPFFSFFIVSFFSVAVFFNGDLLLIAVLIAGLLFVFVVFVFGAIFLFFKIISPLIICYPFIFAKSFQQKEKRPEAPGFKKYISFF